MKKLTIRTWNRSPQQKEIISCGIYFDGDSEKYIFAESRKDSQTIEVKNGSETLTFDNYAEFFNALKKGQQTKTLCLSAYELGRQDVFNSKEQGKYVNNSDGWLKQNGITSTDINDNIEVNPK